MDATRPPLPRLAALGLLIGAGVTGVLLAVAGGTGPAGPAPATTAVATSVASVGTTGPAADLLRGEGHAVWATAADGGPLRWDPCAPIGFVLRSEGAPEGAEDDLRAALAVLAAATGIDLRLLGTTDERPAADRPLVVRDGDALRWAPVLVAWDEPGIGGVPLGSHDRGVAVPVAVRDGDREAFVTAQVVLNVRRTDLRPGFADRADSWGATLLHELAHVLGLAHVDDPAQLMSEDPGSGPVRLGEGDLAGLARLGRGAGCLAAPDPARGATIAR